MIIKNMLSRIHEAPLFYNGAPGRIRTCDLSLRRGSRYPAVPPGRVGYITQLHNYKQGGLLVFYK